MAPNQLPLRDIHLPQAIGWWPPALGWWLLAILLPLLLGFFYWLFRRVTRHTALKAAKKLLLQLKTDTLNDNSKKLQDLSALLRRVAISKTGRAESAGLTGQQWLAFLDQSVKGNRFTQGVGRLLAQGPYQQNAPTDEEIFQLTQLCEDWLIAQHKRKP